MNHHPTRSLPDRAGARPSSGATMYTNPTVAKPVRLNADSIIAAPGDGRAPAKVPNCAPTKLAQAPAVIVVGMFVAAAVQAATVSISDANAPPLSLGSII